MIYTNNLILKFRKDDMLILTPETAAGVTGFSITDAVLSLPLGSPT